MEENTIFFRYASYTKPILEISDNGTDQLIIRFIPYGDEHITVHLLSDGSLLRTHSSSRKPKAIGNKARIDIARLNGYKNPEKHGTYMIHTPLARLTNAEGYHLVGRLIELDTFDPEEKYKREIGSVVITNLPKFMLTLYLSTTDNPCTSLKDYVTTSLGVIYFHVSEPESRL